MTNILIDYVTNSTMKILRIRKTARRHLKINKSVMEELSYNFMKERKALRR